MESDDGEIEALHTEAQVLWKIPDYFSKQKADSFYTSPHFHFLGSTWSLRIYPNGERANQSVEFVGLYVRREIVYEEHDAFLSVGIVCGDRLSGIDIKCVDQLREKHFIFYKNERGGVGFPKFTERRIIQNKGKLIAPGGTLIIKCVGKPLYNTAVHKASQTILDGRNALSQDFQTLLSSDQTSDVSIRVKSRVFRAHKLILTARSGVFAAMFKHDMKESKTGSIDIVDCDPLAFQEFLLFMYTGKIDNLSSENVCDVFSLANKYDLSDLRQICIDFMTENLCLDMVCDVFAIADKFNVQGLRKSAEELFLKNTKSIMSTENWIRFISENPKLATEILMISVK